LRNISNSLEEGGKMARLPAFLTLLLAAATGPGLAQESVSQSQPYAPTAAQEAAFAVARNRLERWSQPRLTRFASEGEIRRWLADARAAREAIPRDPAEGQELTIIEDRQLSHGSAEVKVPVPGVDEGDAVRQSGRFLLMLTGDTLLVIDTGLAPGSPARLVDQANLIGPLYSLRDEILIRGDRVIVSGRAGQGGATLISTLRLGPDGHLADEGNYLVSGEDDARVGIAGEQLVIYSSTDTGFWGASNADFGWPRIRRWDVAAARREAEAVREEERSGTGPVDARGQPGLPTSGGHVRRRAAHRIGLPACITGVTSRPCLSQHWFRRIRRSSLRADRDQCLSADDGEWRGP
jgi:hypothetical protein